MEVGTSQLAKCLGVSTRRIAALCDEGIVIKIDRGRFDLTQSVKNYIDFKVSGATSKEEQSFDDVRTEHEKLKMRKTELAVRRLEGTLHRAEDVERLWTTMATAVKTRLLGLPVKVAPQVVGLEDTAEVQEILRREVSDALSEVSQYDPADYDGGLLDDEDGDDDNEQQEG